MLKEFREFVMRGNVVDLAVAVIIGAAFGKIVDSLVTDVIMPIIGAITGGLDFSNYYLPLSGKVQSGLAYADARKTGAVLGWGQFLTYVVNFIIVAFVLFLVIQAMNRTKARLVGAGEAKAPKAPPADVVLLTEIRDLLKERR
jgi:large conductance mechanosensitive channel